LIEEEEKGYFGECAINDDLRIKEINSPSKMVDKISSKPASGRLTPPSCYSGVGSKNSLAGNNLNLEINETGSVQISNEQSTHERFIPMMHINDGDRFSIDKGDKNRS